MTKNQLYHNYINKLHEVTALPTQSVGVFTPAYKQIVPYLKTEPWKILIPLAFISICIMALLLELSAVQIASLLQQGF